MKRYSSGIAEIKLKDECEFKFKVKGTAGQLPRIIGQATSKDKVLS